MKEQYKLSIISGDEAKAISLLKATFLLPNGEERREIPFDTKLSFYNKDNLEYFTPLSLACMFERKEVIKYLIDQGAIIEIWARNNNFYSSLDIVFKNDSVEIFNLLYNKLIENSEKFRTSAYKVDLLKRTIKNESMQILGNLLEMQEFKGLALENKLVDEELRVIKQKVTKTHNLLL